MNNSNNVIFIVLDYNECGIRLECGSHIHPLYNNSREYWLRIGILHNDKMYYSDMINMKQNDHDMKEWIQIGIHSEL